MNNRFALTLALTVGFGCLANTCNAHAFELLDSMLSELSCATAPSCGCPASCDAAPKCAVTAPSCGCRQAQCCASVACCCIPNPLPKIGSCLNELKCKLVELTSKLHCCCVFKCGCDPAPSCNAAPSCGVAPVVNDG